jgi:polyphosphate kinase
LSRVKQQSLDSKASRDPDYYINRELSWLSFNTRVLEEAQNSNNPLLERVKFLSISASNLDEFYMVRVAGLMDQVRHGVDTPSHDGLNPKGQLELIHDSAVKLMMNQQQAWIELREELKHEHIHVVSQTELTVKDKAWLDEYFEANIFPALTPIAIDPAHPFPFLPNLGIAQIFQLSKERNNKEQIAVIPFPSKLNRFIQLDGRGNRFVLLEDVIETHIDSLFPGFKKIDSSLYRIVRDSDLDIDEDAEDLMRFFESAVKRRRRGRVIRIKAMAPLSDYMRQFIVEYMGAEDTEIMEVEGMIGLACLSELYNLSRPELKYTPFNVRFPERIQDFGGDCFAAIQAKDIVVHHPYESFDVVVKFLQQAAEDPDVISIKQTLYRTSNDSPIVKALIHAAEAGKSVTALVELKARFDEEANIRWARDMERAGVQVVYGFVQLKTHAKLSLVVRRVEGKLKSYVHFGTGNYHPATAKVYTDLSYFTCDKKLCQDASYLFNYLTGYAPPKKYNKISVAPSGLRKSLLALINTEISHAKAGKPATIWAKMNALVDVEIIDALYKASQAGVKILLIVRGICCLKPGVKGLSENITVKSIVGRFLEHSRIYCFSDGEEMPHKKAKVYISSADWMPRNFDRRIEVMVPIENSTVHAQILDQIMLANAKDERQSWELKSNGEYVRLNQASDTLSAHDYFMQNPSLSGRGRALKREKQRQKTKRQAK